MAFQGHNPFRKLQPWCNRHFGNSGYSKVARSDPRPAGAGAIYSSPSFDERARLCVTIGAAVLIAGGAYGQRHGRDVWRALGM